MKAKRQPIRRAMKKWMHAPNWLLLMAAAPVGVGVVLVTLNPLSLIFPWLILMPTMARLVYPAVDVLAGIDDPNWVPVSPVLARKKLSSAQIEGAPTLELPGFRTPAWENLNSMEQPYIPTKTASTSKSLLAKQRSRRRKGVPLEIS